MGQTQNNPANEAGTQRWFRLLEALRECAADHIRIATTDAMIAVEHDWMVSTYIQKSEFTARALATLAAARSDIVDEIEARIRSRFEVMGLANEAHPPSMQTEMERARMARPARETVQDITRMHGESIISFGQQFRNAARGHVIVELANPLDPSFLVEQVLEALASLELPFKMREDLVRGCAREWTRELRAFLMDAHGHFARYEEEQLLERCKKGADNDPGPATSPLEADLPPGQYEQIAQPRKQRITQLHGGYDHFNWSTSLGASDALPEPRLRPSTDDGGHFSLEDNELFDDPTEPKRSSTILPFRKSITRQEAIKGLGEIQRTPPLRIRSAFDGPPKDLSLRLKRELLIELRSIGPHVSAPLSPRDDNAAQQVGDLFQQAQQTVGPDTMPDRAKGALSRMVVPCLKAAVVDREPFETGEHPARKLIHSLAEAIRDSKSGPADRASLMDRAEEAVDRVVAEYNEDMAILAIIEQELRGFMQQWDMTSAIGCAEPGSQARTKSEINATHALLERTAGVTLPYAVAEFMTGPWHRRLIRFGLSGLTGGQEWDQTLEVADQLLALWSVHPPTRRDAIATINALAPQMDAIWLDDGAPADRAQNSRIQMTTAVDDILRPEDIDTHERQVARMTAEMAAQPATDTDRQFVQQLRVGDWILMTGPDGTTRHAKLSWISPISDRRLFVSRQGVRIMVATLDELAAMHRVGRVRVD